MLVRFAFLGNALLVMFYRITLSIRLVLNDSFIYLLSTLRLLLIIEDSYYA